MTSVSRHVLIIDKSASDRHRIASLLRSSDANIKCLLADSLREATEFLNQISVDFILLDVHAGPGDILDSLYVLTSILGDKTTPIVAVGQHFDPKLAIRCLQLGAQDYLTKDSLSAVQLERSRVLSTHRARLEQEVISVHEKAKQMAQADHLTGLCNRSQFERSINFALRQRQDGDGSLAAVLLDIDNFKLINDTYGHQMGDELLRQIAHKLDELAPSCVSIARLGGDEFGLALFFENHKELEQLCAALGNLIRSEVNQDFAIKPNASIGVAWAPEHADSANDLLRAADIAMYNSKRTGRSRVSYYNARLQTLLEHRLTIENALSNPSNQTVKLEFQPIVNRNGELWGAEALCRLQLQGSKLGADDFISIAEDSGAMIALGRVIIREAFSTLSHWLEQRPNINLSINLSPLQLLDHELVAWVDHSARHFQIPPERVCFEITETINFSTDLHTLTQLSDLRQRGYTIALDDFGTGFSSLSHLRTLPIDVVKIDRSCMIDDPSDAANDPFFQAIVGCVQALNLRVCAEGVETRAQLNYCELLNIDRTQGYLHNKPMSVEQFESHYIIPTLLTAEVLDTMGGSVIDSTTPVAPVQFPT